MDRNNVVWWLYVVALALAAALCGYGLALLQHEPVDCRHAVTLEDFRSTTKENER